MFFGAVSAKKHYLPTAPSLLRGLKSDETIYNPLPGTLV